MSRRSLYPSSAAVLAVAAALAVMLSACGGTANGPPRSAPTKYPVDVESSFPTAQRLGERVEFQVSVRNAGRRTIPDVTVAVLNPKYGTGAQSFQTLIANPRSSQPQQQLAGRSRPVWMVNREPGPCGFSCKAGGDGGAFTTYADTWALGSLAPGRTARFVWTLTAVRAGHYPVEYQVDAGLDGNAKAVTSAGLMPEKTFKVTISGQSPQMRFTDSGKVVSGG